MVCKVADWYEPAAQLVHAVASMLLDANVPAAQVSHEILPVCGCALPDSHCTQLDFSLADWYWPSEQSVQIVAIVPENVPGVQIVQMDPATAVLALPAVHASQTLIPELDWNVPLAHASHVV